VTLLVGRQERHLARKKWGVDLLVVTIWLALCMLSMPLPSSLAAMKLANPGSPGNMAAKKESPVSILFCSMIWCIFVDFKLDTCYFDASCFLAIWYWSLLDKRPLWNHSLQPLDMQFSVCGVASLSWDAVLSTHTCMYRIVTQWDDGCDFLAAVPHGFIGCGMILCYLLW